MLQPRFGGIPFSGSEQPMEIGGWLGLAEQRPIDPLSLAFFCDALFPRRSCVSAAARRPTIDLTDPLPRGADRGSAERDPQRAVPRPLSRRALIHEGFFEEDGVIWAPTARVLAHSRQLAILMPLKGA